MLSIYPEKHTSLKIYALKTVPPKGEGLKTREMEINELELEISLKKIAETLMNMI